MSNHYEILGLPLSAGIDEIKAAFRTLAKKYHPDKNPDGKEYFEKILKAYETLSDPRLKSSYDYRLKNNQPEIAEHVRKPKEKNWDFSERELKRRRYYNEYIKQFEKSNLKEATDAALKSNYNEFKYILFATPLAVLLFILIVQFADIGKAPEEVDYKKENKLVISPTHPNNQYGSIHQPYLSYFGPYEYKNTDGQKLKLKNATGAEIIVCLFSKSRFIRSCYLKQDSSAQISELPNETFTFKYCTGSNFDDTCKLNKVNVTGAFTKGLSFFKSVGKEYASSSNQITLWPGPNKNFEKIDETDFFKKE